MCTGAICCNRAIIRRRSASARPRTEGVSGNPDEPETASAITRGTAQTLHQQANRSGAARGNRAVIDADSGPTTTAGSAGSAGGEANYDIAGITAIATSAVNKHAMGIRAIGDDIGEIGSRHIAAGPGTPAIARSNAQAQEGIATLSTIAPSTGDDNAQQIVRNALN